MQPLLDAITEYLPSPLDIPAVEGFHPQTKESEIRRAACDEPLAALCFKIQSDPFVGRLTYVRVYSGRLEVGERYLNSTRGRQERVMRVLRMHANHREDMQAIEAGDIGAVVGLKFAFTGDTLCSPEEPIVLEPISFPEPVISVVVEPKTQADQEKLNEALSRLADEDPTFKVRADEETGQTIIWGMGELHLEILVDRMLREFHVQANVGKPRVAYRETITRAVRTEGRFMRQTAGREHHGHVWLELEPLPTHTGFAFEDALQGEVIPKEFVPAIEQGIRDALESGVLAGYPLVGIRAKLVDGSYIEGLSTELGYRVAASLALRDGVQQAGPTLLEPVMKAEIVVPAESLGEVLADLNGRRAEIQGMTLRGEMQVISCIVPLAEMFGYATEIRSLTQGRGEFTMEFDHYSELPPELMERILGGPLYEMGRAGP